MTAVVIAAVAVLAALWIAQRLGRARAERDFAEKAHEETVAAAARARRIDEEVARLGPRELARRLRAFRRR